MEEISLPQPVQQNLAALRMEREQIQRSINLILATAINMAGGDAGAQYQLSDDCSQLAKVEAE